MDFTYGTDLYCMQFITEADSDISVDISDDIDDIDIPTSELMFGNITPNPQTSETPCIDDIIKIEI